MRAPFSHEGAVLPFAPPFLLGSRATRAVDLTEPYAEVLMSAVLDPKRSRQLADFPRIDSVVTRLSVWTLR